MDNLCRSRPCGQQQPQAPIMVLAVHQLPLAKTTSWSTAPAQPPTPAYIGACDAERNIRAAGAPFQLDRHWKQTILMCIATSWSGFPTV